MSILVLALSLALQVQTADTVELSREQEASAQDLMRETRCMVCACESILDSNAPMAVDMRRFVREEFAAGASDEQVRDALIERFGHEVLLHPGFSAQTAVLWAAPLLILLLGGGLLFGSMRNRRRS